MLANMQNWRRECNSARSCHSLQRILTIEFKTLRALNFTHGSSQYSSSERRCDVSLNQNHVAWMSTTWGITIGRYFCTISCDKRCSKTYIENTTARDKNTPWHKNETRIRDYPLLQETYFERAVVPNNWQLAREEGDVATDGWRRKSRQIQRVAEGRKTSLIESNVGENPAKCSQIYIIGKLA